VDCKPADAGDGILCQPEQDRCTTLIGEPIHGMCALGPDSRVPIFGTAEQHIHDEWMVTTRDQRLAQWQLDGRRERAERRREINGKGIPFCVAACTTAACNSWMYRRLGICRGPRRRKRRAISAGTNGGWTTSTVVERTVSTYALSFAQLGNPYSRAMT
jgi:hypothetical protein